MTTKPRVLMTADAVGGVWTYALDLGRELTARGHEVHLATMGPRPDAEKQRAALQAGLRLHISEYALEWMTDPWQDVTRAGEWLLELAGEINPNIIHLNGYVHAALPWGRPVVVVAHSDVLSWHHWVRKAPAGAEWECYQAKVTAGLRAASALIAPTHAVANDLLREYGIEASVRVIPNFRNPKVYRPGNKEPFILTAGRQWDEAKNGAAAQGHSLPLVAVGDGTARGRVSEAELADLYARAAVFVHPARYEPFGLAVLEAALSGCALVLGDIPSLRENWDGAALFAPPDDREALENALCRAIDEAQDWGEKAQERAARFTPAATTSAYMALYQEVGA